ncbi:hypothetical protein OSTOST_03459 [Ostertagia ostertagi]
MYFIVYQLADIFPVKNFFTRRNFVPDRQTWLKGILDLLPRQMTKNYPALAAILHEYEPTKRPGLMASAPGAQSPLIVRSLQWASSYVDFAHGLATDLQREP